LKKEAHDQLEAQAKSVGKTPDEMAPETVIKKTTAETGAPAKKKRKSKSTEKKSETAVFPAKGVINAYSFLRLSNGVAEAFGVPRGKKTPVTIDFKDGNLIISRA